MPIPIYQVDAFTDRPFSGNPAAVVILEQPANPEWMQLVAMEMNLSETAFLHPSDMGWGLRWFTPTIEVDLCGHATLASAHVLWEAGLLPKDARARFHTRSGLLTAGWNNSVIELDFPATPMEPTSPPEVISEGLGVRLLFAGKNSFDYMVEVESEDVVRSLRPDLEALKALKTRGVIVTALASTPPYDFVSRFFGPGAGIDEDPVTGSAHCALGPYWMEKTGKTRFNAYQASPRGGHVRVRIEQDRVIIAGAAVTVFKGELVS
ncbi:MAG: PhzF family phenazine biosynthesis protein [Desulfovibrionales bacterium]